MHELMWAGGYYYDVIIIFGGQGMVAQSRSDYFFSLGKAPKLRNIK